MAFSDKEEDILGDRQDASIPNLKLFKSRNTPRQALKSSSLSMTVASQDQHSSPIITTASANTDTNTKKSTTTNNSPPISPQSARYQHLPNHSSRFLLQFPISLSPAAQASVQNQDMDMDQNPNQDQLDMAAVGSPTSNLKKGIAFQQRKRTASGNGLFHRKRSSLEKDSTAASRSGSAKGVAGAGAGAAETFPSIPNKTPSRTIPALLSGNSATSPNLSGWLQKRPTFRSPFRTPRSKLSMSEASTLRPDRNPSNYNKDVSSLKQQQQQQQPKTPSIPNARGVVTNNDVDPASSIVHDVFELNSSGSVPGPLSPRALDIKRSKSMRDFVVKSPRGVGGLPPPAPGAAGMGAYVLRYAFDYGEDWPGTEESPGWVSSATNLPTDPFSLALKRMNQTFIDPVLVLHNAVRTTLMDLAVFAVYFEKITQGLQIQDSNFEDTTHQDTGLVLDDSDDDDDDDDNDDMHEEQHNGADNNQHQHDQEKSLEKGQDIHISPKVQTNGRQISKALIPSVLPFSRNDFVVLMAWISVYLDFIIYSMQAEKDLIKEWIATFLRDSERVRVIIENLLLGNNTLLNQLHTTLLNIQQSLDPVSSTVQSQLQILTDFTAAMPKITGLIAYHFNYIEKFAEAHAVGFSSPIEYYNSMQTLIRRFSRKDSQGYGYIVNICRWMYKSEKARFIERYYSDGLQSKYRVFKALTYKQTVAFQVIQLFCRNSHIDLIEDFTHLWIPCIQSHFVEQQRIDFELLPQPNTEFSHSESGRFSLEDYCSIMQILDYEDPNQRDRGIASSSLPVGRKEAPRHTKRFQQSEPGLDESDGNENKNLQQQQLSGKDNLQIPLESNTSANALSAVFNHALEKNSDFRKILAADDILRSALHQIMDEHKTLQALIDAHKTENRSAAYGVKLLDSSQYDQLVDENEVFQSLQSVLPLRKVMSPVTLTEDGYKSELQPFSMIRTEKNFIVTRAGNMGRSSTTAPTNTTREENVTPVVSIKSPRKSKRVSPSLKVVNFLDLSSSEPSKPSSVKYTPMNSKLKEVPPSLYADEGLFEQQRRSSKSRKDSHPKMQRIQSRSNVDENSVEHKLEFRNILSSSSAIGESRTEYLDKSGSLPGQLGKVVSFGTLKFEPSASNNTTKFVREFSHDLLPVGLDEKANSSNPDTDHDKSRVLGDSKTGRTLSVDLGQDVPRTLSPKAMSKRSSKLSSMKSSVSGPLGASSNSKPFELKPKLTAAIVRIASKPNVGQKGESKLFESKQVPSPLMMTKPSSKTSAKSKEEFRDGFVPPNEDFLDGLTPVHKARLSQSIKSSVGVLRKKL